MKDFSVRCFTRAVPNPGQWLAISVAWTSMALMVYSGLALLNIVKLMS